MRTRRDEFTSGQPFFTSNIMRENIREYTNTARRDVRVDADAGILYGVKIIGCRSRNGREYPNDILCKAIPLYEKTKVNLDHPEGDPTKPRSYQDRFGAIHNVRLKENEGLFADFHFNPKHVVAAQLLWDAENAPDNVGFSHNVEALVRRENDRVIVEKILNVRSVDLVADPATTAGLFESFERQNPKSEVLESETETVTETRELIQPQDDHSSGPKLLLSLCEYMSHKISCIAPGFDVLLGKDFLESLADIDDRSLQIRLLEERLQLFEYFNMETIAEKQPVSREQVVREKNLDTKAFVKMIRR